MLSLTHRILEAPLETLAAATIQVPPAPAGAVPPPLVIIEAGGQHSAYMLTAYMLTAFARHCPVLGGTLSTSQWDQDREHSVIRFTDARPNCFPPNLAK